MNRSTPGLPVHHQLPEFTQTHVHRVSDAIQPSHPLLSPSPPAPNPSQHQGLFQCQVFTWGGQSIGVSASASVLPMNTQDWSPLGWTGWISLHSKGLSRVFSNTRVKEESEKVGLKLNIQKTKLMASGPITSWEIDGETVADFIFGGQNHCRWWLQPWNKKTLNSLEGKLWPTQTAY